MRISVDIAVVGAGAAGIAAAVSAARTGQTTLLLDQRPAAGGTGGFSGLTTLCGLFDDTGRWLNEGFAREFAEMLVESPPLQMGKVWVLPYRPETFRQTAAALINSLSNLQTQWNTALTSVTVEHGRLVRLNDIEVGAVIDCSGSAEIARLAGLDCLATDETTQASAVIFPLCGVRRELNSPAAVAQVLLPLARAGFPPLNFQPNPEPGSITVKFTGGAEQVTELVAFLQRSVEGFERCQAPLARVTAAQRKGRMIVGEYLLTGAEVLAGRKFSDAVARGAWPIEQWNADGVARFRYLPPGTHYEIPARSLRAARVNNLFMAGKTMSADVDAIASARVMGCCLATGAAAGVLAADYLQSSRSK
ncbi:MAG: FAD-dependent oxidoreductase [Verrucomicrobiae bacterium]|nr:FAD-dependent oxidoreductase [Verrucomicrobiae bacterium]